MRQKKRRRSRSMRCSFWGATVTSMISQPAACCATPNSTKSAPAPARSAHRLPAAATLAGVRVLVLTPFELAEYVFEALAAGASGFLLKNTDPMELLRAVRVVAEGEALLAPSVTRRLVCALR